MDSLIMPTAVDLRRVKSFLNKSRFPWPTSAGSVEVLFNDQWTYLSPLALTMLAAWGREMESRGCEVSIARGASTLGYAKRLGLFEFMKTGNDLGAVQEHEQAGRFVRLTEIRSQAGANQFITDCMPLFHHEETANVAGYCLGELLRNVLEHAGGKPALACAQYYPSKGIASIAVADTGMGLRASLSRNYPSISSDVEAAAKALEPGVTGAAPALYGGMENAGVGLFMTKQLAKLARGEFVIYSGTGGYHVLPARSDAQLETLWDDTKLDPRAEALVYAQWTGTVVAIDIMPRESFLFEDILQIVQADAAASQGLEALIRFE